MEDYDIDPKPVSRFTHENALWHYGEVNKRSLRALVAVCITFVVITAIFVIGYTVREKNWLDYVSKLQAPVAEVAADGIHEQQNP